MQASKYVFLDSDISSLSGKNATLARSFIVKINLVN